MIFVIRAIGAEANRALLPIAGRPLIYRQLEFLRAARPSAVLVQLGADEASDAISAALEAPDAACRGVTVVYTRGAVDAQELLARAGLGSTEELTIEVPTGALMLGDATAFEAAAVGPTGVLRLRPPPNGRAEGEVNLPYSRGSKRSFPRVTLLTRAHGLLIRDLATALRATATLLTAGANRSDIVIPGTEVAHGVFFGRGVQVSADARLIGPVLLEAGAVVQAGATVGPNVALGAGAVVESGATLENVAVEAEAIIGRGVFVQDAWVSGGKLVSALGGESVDLGDRLLVAGAGENPQLVSRGVAVLAAGAARLLAPGSVAAERLSEVARGDRAWFGFSSRAPSGVAGPGLEAASRRAPLGLWDVEELLVPPDSNEEDRLRSRAWYGVSKSLTVDASLALRLVLRRAGVER